MKPASPGPEEVAREVGSLLAGRGQSLAVGESCTGGRLADLITAVPGSSRYFLGGVIAYSDRVKAGLLGVSRQTLREVGAVSPRVAEEMAAGTRGLFGCDYALSTTGIAGPGGGTEDKPVGLVYLGLAGPAGGRAEELHLQGERQAIKQEAAHAALRLLWEVLLERP